MLFAAMLFLLGAPAASVPPLTLDAGTVIAELERNRRALRDYRWSSSITVELGGEVVDLVPGSNRGTKLEKKVAETRRRLEALLASYTEIGADRVQTAFAAARVTQGASGEPTLIQTRDVIRRGDSVKIMVDSETLRPRRYEVLTSLDGEPVQLRMEFAELDGGPSYPARVVVDTEIKEKKMVITTENSDYVRFSGSD